MPFAAKSGVDWDRGRRLYEEGATLKDTAAALGVTRQSIEYRIKKQGWVGPREVTRLEWRQRLVRQRAEKAAVAGGVVLTDEDADRVEMESLPEIKKRACEFAALGGSRNMIAQMLAVKMSDLNAWMATDRVFEARFRLANLASARKRIEQIEAAGDKDWRAAAWLLERSPATKEEFSELKSAPGGGPQIIVQVAVMRHGDTGPEQVAVRAMPVMIEAVATSAAA